MPELTFYKGARSENYGFLFVLFQVVDQFLLIIKQSQKDFQISTQSLDYTIGTFRLSLANYDTISATLNTIFSTQAALEEGLTKATAEG